MNNLKKHSAKILLTLFFSLILIFIANSNEWFFKKETIIVKTDFLKFSHSKHIELGNDCESCHSSILNSTNNFTKTFPTHSDCQTCHEEEINSKCGYCHTNANDPKPIPEINSKIIFNHKIHNNKLKCLDCHPDLDKTDFATDINFAKMEKCSSCHNNKTSSADCEKCHTDISNLFPKSHSVSIFKREHSKIINSKNENLCQSCHTENDCMVCHDANNLENISSIEKSAMLSPRSVGNINSKIFTGQLVHDINYRFSHSIEAKGKSFNCQSCHQKETFCNDCHKDGSVALGGVIPTSHEQNNFTTIGVGTGGGVHAQLAKKDIESCASCHDSFGEDPNCITCHNDPDGILNTNPKTHKSKFYLKVNGNWHSDQNANCYSCHYDANAQPNGQSGIGFCGYCHGKK